jgi:hypothetical protein
MFCLYMDNSSCELLCSYVALVVLTKSVLCANYQLSFALLVLHCLFLTCGVEGYTLLSM